MDITLMTTVNLWTLTNAALCAGRWSEARALLDDLGRRSNVVDRLMSIGLYERAAGKSLRPDFRSVLADRIELVNSKI